MSITIYTDGSIITNPGGAGGWAAIVVSGERHRIISGSEYDTTNNRMEMRAAIEGLRLFLGSRKIRLVSDSEYLIHGFTKGWVENWAANGWTRKAKAKTAKGHNGMRTREEIPNADLWQDLNNLDIRHEVEWIHQRGEHRHHDTLSGPERYAALAHAFALSEARIAHWTREKNIEGLDTPATLEEREALVCSIKELPTPPDAPIITPPVTYAVFRRTAVRKHRFQGPVYFPMRPSECTDGEGIRDGGRWECHKAAEVMNRTDDSKEAGKFRTNRTDQYVVLRQTLNGGVDSKGHIINEFELTQSEYDYYMKEAGKNDGVLRAVPGGRAGGRISGSLATG